jgi:ribosomal protein L11 methyltransferase
MSWNQITIDVPDELKDAVVGEISESGIAGVWESAQPRPGETRLVIYFDHPTEMRAIESRIASIFGPSFPIGNDFFIVPSWCPLTCPDDRLPIQIDPGQAFGTGTHETTQLTMEALERWVEPHQHILDLGTGSGILAIASRLLGAREVFACDIDPVAVHVAEANIRRNSEHEIWTFCGSIDAVRPGSIDLILCNLTADVIIELFPEIDRVLRRSGYAIFSGILNEQSEDVRARIDGFHYSVHEEMSRGEWLALVAEKNGP